jgi:hypothetical protein
MGKLLIPIIFSTLYLSFRWLLSTLIYERPIISFELRKSCIYLCLILAVIYAIYTTTLQKIAT